MIALLGSGALNCKMLDLGLLKISLGDDFFFIFLAPAGSSNTAKCYPSPFLNPAGQSYNLLNLT